MNVIVKGLAELAPKLDSLERRVKGNVIRRGLRAGAKITYAGALGTVPVLSGALRGAIKVRAGKSKRGGFAINVGVGESWFKGDQFYGAFVEFGHRLGKRKLGDKRKKVAGEHFILYAYEETREQALNVAVETMMTELDSAVSAAAGGST